MKERKVPMRRCIGCMESKEKNQLIRIAGYEGQITVDPTGRAKGRGAYICRGSVKCLEKAFKKKAFERNLGIDAGEKEKQAILRQMEELKDEG